MNTNNSDDLRGLLSALLDGELSDNEVRELNELIAHSPSAQKELVDHLLLDSLLVEQVGAEALTALVDMLATDSPLITLSRESRQASRSEHRWRVPARLRKFSGWLAGIAAVVLVAILVGRWEKHALAGAEAVVRAAIEIHSEPIERVYAVTIDRAAFEDDGIGLRHALVATQGDRFYVEMIQAERQCFWSRNRNGGMWLTLGSQRAIVVEQEEIGAPLQRISDLCALELETLLQNFLKHCRLNESDASGSSLRIEAIPRKRWRDRRMKHAVIEIDRKTKVVRSLVIEQDRPRQGPSTVTFTLIDTRIADESKFQPEGHLVEPFELITRDTQPDMRRELAVGWFGAVARRWIKTPGTNLDE